MKIAVAGWLSFYQTLITNKQQRLLVSYQTLITSRTC